MAKRLDRREVVSFEEALRNYLYELEALRRVLVRRAILTDQEVLDEIRVVRRELESRRTQ
jgi:hypothetical protein